MALLQGLELLDTIAIPRLVVFGDSRQVIYKMINGYSTGSIQWRRLYDRITPLLSNKIDLFHILLQTLWLIQGPPFPKVIFSSMA